MVYSIVNMIQIVILNMGDIMKKLFNLVAVVLSITAVNVFSMDIDMPEGAMSAEHMQQRQQEWENRERQRLNEELHQQRAARQQEERQARAARRGQNPNARRRLHY